MKSDIIERDGRFYFVIDGEESESYADKKWCQDDMEDRISEIKADENDYFCQFCNEYFLKNSVNQRLEDQSFTAPYGELYELVRDEELIEICPICGYDLEITK